MRFVANIVNSTFDGNAAHGSASDGAIYNLGTMTITNTTFSGSGAALGNATGIGGAIYSGRLPEETYELVDVSWWMRFESAMGCRSRCTRRTRGSWKDFVRREWVNAFYRTVQLRVQCCEIRKVNPLRKVLQELDAWVSGLRRDQWTTRKDIMKVEIDNEHGGLLKLSPLADGTEDQVWEYIRAHDVPNNRLYQQGYRSIGCAPCTRPTGADEDPRAGRWWWEQRSRKECGIHCKL